MPRFSLIVALAGFASLASAATLGQTCTNYGSSAPEECTDSSCGGGSICGGPNAFCTNDNQCAGTYRCSGTSPTTGAPGPGHCAQIGAACGHAPDTACSFGYGACKTFADGQSNRFCGFSFAGSGLNELCSADVTSVCANEAKCNLQGDKKCGSLGASCTGDGGCYSTYSIDHSAPDADHCASGSRDSTSGRCTGLDTGAICVSGTECKTGFCFAGVCTLAPNDYTCSQDSQCASSLCDNALCKAQPKELGETCTVKADCRGSLECSSGVCGGNGSACRYANDCVTTHCSPDHGNTCQPIPGLGQRCNKSSWDRRRSVLSKRVPSVQECDTGLACSPVDDTCGGESALCSATENCDSGRACAQSTGTCTNLPIAGALCLTNTENEGVCAHRIGCVDGTCGAKTASCEADFQCDESANLICSGPDNASTCTPLPSVGQQCHMRRFLSKRSLDKREPDVGICAPDCGCGTDNICGGLRAACTTSEACDSAQSLTCNPENNSCSLLGPSGYSKRSRRSTEHMRKLAARIAKEDRL